MKRACLLFIGLLLAGGCGPWTVRTHPSTPTTSSVPPTTPSPTGSSPPTLLPVPSSTSTPQGPVGGPAIVLTASLGSKPVPWHLVARIPFGAAANELGILTDRMKTPVPVLPPSFAVAPDGSFWVADSIKLRLAHYSAAGMYLGSVSGLYFDRDHPRARDLVATRGGLDVLEVRDFVSQVTRFGQKGRLSSVSPAAKAILDLLFSAPHGVTGSLAGSYTGSGHIGSTFSAEPQGFASFDPSTSGALHLLPGLPVAPGLWIRSRLATPTADQTYTLTYSSANSTEERHVRFRIVRAIGNKPIRGVVGASIQAGLDRSVGMFVRLSTSDPNQHTQGGNWYLQVGPGQPVVWERLPTSPINDSQQVRHLAAGPNGSVYLMVADANGESIYRR